ncbi:hypothetical protein [Psychroflexus lacisalsi]|jgi:hypothetical protein|uniref:Uncharacterized protein n=1 Tax=Psychroflexus lacisalsi TaxID=503928 RepID=A0ABN1K600_9FLAO|nr:hypothetical protein [Psychroflexus lacisalsi]MBZ9619193.1 hypothetical protein [Psychroflexus lacisalsi]
MGRRARTITRSSTGSFGINGISFGNKNNGITKFETAGLNFVNEWDKKYEVSSDYFSAVIIPIRELQPEERTSYQTVPFSPILKVIQLEIMILTEEMSISHLSQIP